MNSNFVIIVIVAVLAFSGGLYFGTQNGNNAVNTYLKRFTKSDVACMAIAYEGEAGVRKVAKLKVFDGIDPKLNPIKNGVYDPAPLIATCSIANSKKKELITKLPDKGISQSLTTWVETPWTEKKSTNTGATTTEENGASLKSPPNTNKP